MGFNDLERSRNDSNINRMSVRNQTNHVMKTFPWVLGLIATVLLFMVIYR